MNINFTEKELAIIELFAPEMDVETIINIVLRSWFNQNRYSLYKRIKTETEVNDEIIAISTAKQAELVAEVDNAKVINAVSVIIK